MPYLKDYEHFIYNDKKDICYNWSQKEHNHIFMERNEDFINIKINNVSISLPKTLFVKVLENEGGQFTFEKQQFKLNKLKSSSNIDITIRDANGNIEKSEIYSPHFNTHDWEQFKNFILGYEPIMILSLGQEIETYDKKMKREIGYGLYVYNFNHLNLDQMYDNKQSRSYPTLRDNYTYSVNTLETNQEWKKNYYESILEVIEKYLETSNKPILVQNLEEIQNILNIELPQERIYNFDDILPYDEFIKNKNHPLVRDLCIYIDAPHQNALTLSKLYFDKEIIKNEDNNLDKFVKISEEINNLEPILDFNI